MKWLYQKNPVMKSVKYEENEIRLKRLEDHLNGLQESEEKQYLELRDEISKLRMVIDKSKSVRENIIENDMNEFGLMERKLQNLLDQSSRVDLLEPERIRKTNSQTD